MKKDRLLSLDVFRGITIAAMILVNDPGAWSHVYSPLLHAKWHGCTPTDLVFPFFLFMVGLAVSLGSPKEGEARREITKKIAKRSLYLFLIGLFLNAFPNFDLANLRIPGVLQRIGLVFLAIGIMHHYISSKTQVIIGSGLLIFYWLLMTFVPVPGIGQANLDPDTNFAAWFDRLFLTGHMWRNTDTWDPEGLLSTLPAIVTGLLGMFTGKLLFKIEDKQYGVIRLFALANMLIFAALAWDITFPINKSLWTSSYVLYTAGIAMHFFAMLYWLLDIKKYTTKFTYPFKVFGSNAITAYAFSGILASTIGLISLGDEPAQRVVFDFLLQLFGDHKFSSLVYALAFVAVCYVPVLVLYRKNIFIKV